MASSEKGKKITLTEMFGAIEEVEKCRELVDDMQEQLDSAKSNLESLEQRVADQIELLDPKTKKRFKSMMGGLNTTTETSSKTTEVESVVTTEL